MTQDNFNYRTDQFFLRNQFDRVGKYGIPIIQKADFTGEDFSDLRLIGYDKIKSDDGEHASRMVHFFLYDYKFERAWEEPDADIEYLQKYRAVLTPDFSMYTEMPEALLLYNVFRNRWCGAYFASQGLRVIPTVNFGLSNSFDFCFDGIEKGSTVALSTYMVQEKEGREAQKDFFMAGYNEMLRRIEPEAIICYHEPFPEMQGNIVYVNYELSSWQHMDDDAEEIDRTKSTSIAGHSLTRGHIVTKYGYVESGNHFSASSKDDHVVKHTGYVVQLGAGSAYGGKWRPKKEEDERFLGKPGEIVETDSGRYNRETKIGADGRAEKERHHTDHGFPKYHSSPHDHIIKYTPDGKPDWPNSEQINYWDGNIPVFKSISEDYRMERRIIKANSLEENAFTSIADFQDCMERGGEVEFRYMGEVYSIIHAPFPFITIGRRETENTAVTEDSIVHFESSYELLDYIVEGKKLREIIEEITVLSRTI